MTFKMCTACTPTTHHLSLSKSCDLDLELEAMCNEFGLPLYEIWSRNYVGKKLQTIESNS